MLDEIVKHDYPPKENCVLVNKNTRKVHTGYFSYVAPKIYIRIQDARTSRTKMYKPDDWEIWRVNEVGDIILGQKPIDPNPMRKRYDHPRRTTW